MEIWTKKGRKGELIFSFNKYLCADYLIYADSTPYKMTGPKIKCVIYITYGIKIIIEVYGRKRGKQRTKDLADAIIGKSKKPKKL